MRISLSFFAPAALWVLFAACSGGDADVERRDGLGGLGPAGSADAAGSAAEGSGDGSGGGSGAPTDFGRAPVQPSLDPSAPATGQVVPESCARANVVATRVVPTVMLLVDGSQSMMDACYPDGPAVDGGTVDPMMPCIPAQTGRPSRWDAIRQALSAPDGFVAQLQEVVKFGLAVYGTAPTCPLPLGIVDPQLGNANAIAAGLPAVAPGLTTPTGLALQEVVNLLPDPSQALDEPIGPQVILLATDGDPNACDSIFTNLQPSIQAALMGQAKSQQIYVISVGNESTAAHLQELANIGAGLDRAASPGAEVYYPEDPATLADTLKSLVGDAISCELQLEGKGVQPGKECRDSVVTLNGKELECNGENGWQLVSPTRIELLGTACEQLQGDVAAQLTANFPCDVLVE